MTNIKLRQLYYLFGHPSTRKLHLLLKHNDYKIDKKILDNLIKYCMYFQKYEKLSSYFKFILNEIVNLNYSIFIDIMYFDSNLI